MRASVLHRAVVSWLLMLASLSQLSSAEPGASRAVKPKKVAPPRTADVTPPLSPDTSCIGPPETGNCRAAIPSWFYNTETKKCERFTYGGCGGNENRHKTIEDCRAKCEQAQQTVSPRPPKQGGRSKVRPGNRIPETAMSITTSTGGRVAVVVGTRVNLTCNSIGTNPISWVFYPPHSFQTVYVFSGNQLNANFSSQVSVESSQGQSTLTITKVKPGDRGRYECLEELSTSDGVLFELIVYNAASPGACSGPSVTGKCRALMPKWYFDVNTNSCKRFVYGGCDGSENRYDSRPECERTCVGRPTESTPDETTTSSAADTAAEAEATTIANRRGGGGGGKKNRNGETTRKPRVIRRSIRNNQPRREGTAVQLPVCEGPAVTGRCRGAFRKWFYNEIEAECQQFIYGGCGGSANRHNSREECERKCRR